MLKICQSVVLTAAVLCLSSPRSESAAIRTKSKPEAEEITGQGPAELWRYPSDIATRNLFYGPGKKAHVPHGTFTYLKEDLGGSNPKFDVIDSGGVKWKVKMGEEARPE